MARLVVTRPRSPLVYPAVNDSALSGYMWLGCGVLPKID
jgi:hypothetical protein